MEKIVIVGAGGFGREVAWLIDRINSKEKKYEIIGFADDNKVIGEAIGNSKVIFTIDELCNYSDNLSVCVAIGNAKVRKQIIDKLLRNSNISFPNLIDPSVIYSTDEVKMGVGNIICAGTIMTVNISIGDFNIINLDCTIGHDDIINNYITIYPSVNVSGCVVIGNCTEIGTGTQIIQGLSIASDSIIGASAAVVKNLIESGTYVGVPARRIK